MTNIGEEFIEKTKYKHLGQSDQQKGLPQPTVEKDVSPESMLINLPNPKSFDPPTLNIRELIEERRSTRSYSEKPLTLGELSYLLWCTQGVKETPTINATLRTVPSAGARHAYETYLLINKVEGLEDGLYRFQATKHKLIKLKTTPDIAEKITEACLMQRFVMASAVTFIWVAVQYRMTWRYQERGYRYLNLDAGHICQNLYLAGEAIACGTCAIGAYDDNQINTLLGLNGIDEFVVYIASTGKKK
jgi:SagB-type dehydrogenase family enzyme